MKEILTEWRQFLVEQEEENKVQSVVKSIIAANGKISLPPEDLKLLQRYVSNNSKTEPLGAAYAADALSAYFKTNGNDTFARSYGEAAKRLRGLSKYSGNKPLTRAADTFLGADDPVVEKGLYNSKDRPKFAKFIADLAAGVKSSTGIRILDPTLPATPPEWAKKYPNTYAALQLTADFLASDPISLLSMAIPAGKISGAIEKKLAQGLRKEVSAGLQKAAQAAAKGEEKATQQILKKTVQDAQKTLENLHLYVHSFSRGMSPELAKKLLRLGKEGKAVTYSGTAYRGARVNDPLHLVDQMIIPGIKKRTDVDYFAHNHNIPGRVLPKSKIDSFMREELRKAWNSKDWVEIKVPRGAKLDTGGRGALSFTTDFKQAQEFSSTYGVGDKFEVIFQTSGGDFIDVVQTLEKSGLGIDAAMKVEKEVLAIGEPTIERIFVRRRVN